LKVGQYKLSILEKRGREIGGGGQNFKDLCYNLKMSNLFKTGVLKGK
jgi:hypothetical protein